MAEMPDSHPDESRRKRRAEGMGAPSVTARRDNSLPAVRQLMEAVVNRENMLRAYQRVMANKGAPGIDEMTVEQLMPYLQKQWAIIKAELLAGSYQPQPVRAVEIAKPGGGVRQLGIPCVLDRLIQQALHQILTPIFDPYFSESSYGFRPNRSAHMAVLQAREYVREGRRWVVDIDLEKFFDRVNHDKLMSLLARKVGDKRVLKLIRSYLQAGMMRDGLVSPRDEGTPQGGPLSPLLSNILLDELDQELQRRGHKFCRYADDCNIYVQSKRAGERVMASVTKFLENRLHLKVNAIKSAVARVWERKFLGYSMTWHKQARLKVSPAAVTRLKEKLKRSFRAGKGRNLEQFIKELSPKLAGWMNYFRLAEVKSVFEELDGWIRRRLRMIIWRQWKRPSTREQNLMQRGIEKHRAWRSATNGRGPWWCAGASYMHEAFPKSYFDKLGLVCFIDKLHRLPTT